MNVIESPSWEIKNHFHILSSQHLGGNQQPDLLQIAEVLQSRLQIIKTILFKPSTKFRDHWKFTKGNNKNNGIKQQKPSNISSPIHQSHQDRFTTNYLGRLGIIRNT